MLARRTCSVSRVMVAKVATLTTVVHRAQLTCKMAARAKGVAVCWTTFLSFYEIVPNETRWQEWNSLPRKITELWLALPHRAPVSSPTLLLHATRTPCLHGSHLRILLPPSAHGPSVAASVTLSFFLQGSFSSTYPWFCLSSDRLFDSQVRISVTAVCDLGNLRAFQSRENYHFTVALTIDIVLFYTRASITRLPIDRRKRVTSVSSTLKVLLQIIPCDNNYDIISFIFFNNYVL